MVTVSRLMRVGGREDQEEEEDLIYSYSMIL